MSEVELSRFDGDQQNETCTRKPSEICVQSREVGEGQFSATVRITFAVANATINTGIFLIPYSFVLVGWMDILCIGAAAALLIYTASLLSDVLDALHAQGISQPTYEHIGERILGLHFAFLFTCAFCGDLLLKLVMFYIFIADTLRDTFGWDRLLVLCFTSPVSMMLMYMPRGMFIIFDVCSLLVVVSTIGMCAATGLALESKNTSQSFIGHGGLIGTFIGLGATAFAMGEHTVFASLYVKNRNKIAYRRGLYTGLTLFLILTFVLGIIGYATFGTSLKVVVLGNIGKDVNHKELNSIPSWVPDLCNTIVCVKIVQVMPMFLSPVIDLLADAAYKIGIDLRKSDVAHSELVLFRENPGRFYGRLFVVSSCFIACATCAICLRDHLSKLEGFIGAFFIVLNCVTVPCLGYRALCVNGQSSTPISVWIALTCGILWGILGTIVTLTGADARETTK